MAFKDVKKNFNETEVFLREVIAQHPNDTKKIEWAVTINTLLLQQFEIYGTLDSIDIQIRRIADSLEKIANPKTSKDD